MDQQYNRWVCNEMLYGCAGLLRRATVQKHLGNLQVAINDVNTVLHIEPQNEIAKVNSFSHHDDHILIQMNT